MVVTLGQRYNIGEKPTVTLHTYINRHALIIAMVLYCAVLYCTLINYVPQALLVSMYRIVILIPIVGVGKRVAY